jgi:hypothetical protein
MASKVAPHLLESLLDFHGDLGVCNAHKLRLTPCRCDKRLRSNLASSPFMQWVRKLVKDQDRTLLQTRVERGQRKERRGKQVPVIMNDQRQQSIVEPTLHKAYAAVVCLGNDSSYRERLLWRLFGNTPLNREPQLCSIFQFQVAFSPLPATVSPVTIGIG